MSDFHKQLQFLIHDLLTPDLQSFRNRSRALKQKNTPRNRFNCWRSHEGKLWKSEKYKQTGGCCQKCQVQFTIGNLVIDHIKPIKHFPDLAVDTHNLQLLCHECNSHKGSNYD